MRPIGVPVILVDFDVQPIELIALIPEVQSMHVLGFLGAHPGSGCMSVHD
jgi:hypothetical protein